MFRIAGFSSVAAAVMFLHWPPLLDFHHNGPSGFAQVVERVQKSKTVFFIKQKLGQKPELDEKRCISRRNNSATNPRHPDADCGCQSAPGIELYSGVKVAKRMSLEGPLQAEAFERSP